MVEPSPANAEDLKERGSGHFSLEAKLLGATGSSSAKNPPLNEQCPAYVVN
jgi:hypothetical protein